MQEWYIHKHIPRLDKALSAFEELLQLFNDILIHTSGDVGEALHWLNELDKHYDLTPKNYGIGDFVQDLIDKGYIREGEAGEVPHIPSAKLENALRKQALDEVFGKLKNLKRGNHKTKKTGLGTELTQDLRKFQFGDKTEHIALAESLKNAQINHGLDNFMLSENDLEVREPFYETQLSTVLMIDISHSMILYGEDRITPAKKVAMALAELIKLRYPKDKLDVITFGDDAQRIAIKDIPYLQVGPYHTNTIAGIELAIQLLRKRKTANKQILMITDGKPSAMWRGKKLYKNPMGLDKRIVRRTLAMAYKCRKLDIPITTFAIAQDPYLLKFIEDFTNANNGKAFYASLDDLGSFIIKDYTGKKSNL